MTTPSLSGSLPLKYPVFPSRYLQNSRDEMMANRNCVSWGAKTTRDTGLSLHTPATFKTCVATVGGSRVVASLRRMLDESLSR